MLGEVFQRFVQRSPISVMVRGTLERVLGAEQLNQCYERTAKNQDTRELVLFDRRRAEERRRLSSSALRACGVSSASA